jgi:hypothetical protein
MSNALHAFDLRDPAAYDELKQGVQIRVDATTGDIYQRPMLDLITPPCDKISLWAYGQRMIDSTVAPIVYPFTINWRLVFGTMKGIDYGAAMAVNGATVLVNSLAGVDLSGLRSDLRSVDPSRRVAAWHRGGCRVHPRCAVRQLRQQWWRRCLHGRLDWVAQFALAQRMCVEVQEW